MVLTPLKFAVVREDPAVESLLVSLTDAKRVLLVAAGGCTALTLLGLHDHLHVTAFDLNPAQVEHTRVRHRMALEGIPPDADAMSALLQSGQFEALFRALRGLLHAFVISPEDLLALCNTLPPQDRAQRVDALAVNPWWSTAFDLMFSDRVLNAMFGPAATQHAQPGSYPRHFRTLLEAALRTGDAVDNPFMHHVLLGRYLPHAPPAALQRPLQSGTLQLVTGTLGEVDSTVPFDVVSLSNLMDWMDPAQRTKLAGQAEARLRPGGMVCLRQLNNTSNITSVFSSVEWDAPLSAELTRQERSRFYTHVWVGRRTRAEAARVT
jgi:S-adenosylmethionine-diacylglycerol 3-amino-3-carboxypropyl transferase